MNIAFTVLRAVIFRVCLYFSLLSSSDLSFFLLVFRDRVSLVVLQLIL